MLPHIFVQLQVEGPFHRLPIHQTEQGLDVLGKAHRLARVWGKECVGEHHMLQVNINRLRHKLEVDPTHQRYLLTERGSAIS